MNRANWWCVVVALAAIAGCGRERDAKHEQPPSADTAEDLPTPNKADVPRRAPAPPLLTPERVAALVRDLRVDNWYGFYVAGKKIGYARVWIGPAPQGSPAPFASGMEIAIHSNDDSRTVVSHTERTQYYEDQPPFRLVERRDVDVSPDGRAERSYIADGMDMIIRQVIDGKNLGERRLPRTKETVDAMLTEFGLDATDVVAGQSIAVTSFDVDEERDRQTVVIVREVREQIVSGVPMRIAILESQDEGDNVVTEITVASRGIVLSATIGESMKVLLEEKDVAQSGVEGFSVYSDAVAVDRKLGDPSSISSLDLVVGVPKGYELAGNTVSAEERKRALAVTSSIDSDNPELSALARQVTRTASTPRKKIDEIVHWVYGNLDKSLSTNLTVASQVLDKRVGDCTEHTILLVAMARAVGIPAREVSGLIYMGDQHQSFGWHAWAEVELDGRWVGVDGAWNEPIASAAHLMLGVEYSSDWVSAMGQITLSAP